MNAIATRAAALALLASASVDAHAQETPPATESAEIVDEESVDPGAEPPESIDGDLAETEVGSSAGLLPEGPITWLYNLWKPWTDELDERYGLRLGVAWTAVYQHAFASEGFRNVAGFDADFYGKWRLLGAKDGLNNGYVGFYTEYREELFEPVPARLGPEIGSAWKTVDGFNEQDFALTQLYWEQHAFENAEGDALVASVGKIKADNFYSTNRASNDNLLFLNRAFSSNPAMNYPGAGLGLNLKVQTDSWYVTAGLQDAQGKKTTSGFNTVGDGDFFYAGEVGLTPEFEGLGRGDYRFTYWYSAAVEASGAPASQGFSLSFDQELIPESFGAFLRFGTSDDFTAGIENLVAAGVLGRLIPGRPDDVWGVGVSWGEPTSGGRDQWTTELFYRLQLGTREQLTFGVQIINDPSDFPSQDQVEVFEARFRIAF
jgi:hypothetical protein